MSVENPDLHLARAFAEETNTSVFLTGKAGTGKTTFLHRLMASSNKRLIVTAPTGVAAINAGGVTLHSFFQLPFGPCPPGTDPHRQRYRFSREKRNIIKALDMLVIDEISMVRADLLDAVDVVLRRLRRSELPFGGVQLLMIGDLLQLAPVVKEDEWELLKPHYPTPYFFHALALKEIPWVAVELRHIYRQSDPTFITILNQVRTNRLQEAELQQLNRRYLPDFLPKEEEGFITLCTHNSRAEQINQQRLQAVAGKSRFFGAEVEGEFPEQAYPTAARMELKQGAQVMFLRNDADAAKRYFNGKIGTITRMGEEEISVLCPGESDEILVKPVRWENIQYSIDPETAEISKDIVGSFSQFPLKTAWAITIHKSQGLTFDKAIIDAQSAFAPGQVYVGLSRCRTLEGLVLSSPLNARGIETDPAVLHFVSWVEDNRPDETVLERAKNLYQRQLLLSCFDFQRLAQSLGYLGHLLRSHVGSVEIISGRDPAQMQEQVSTAICQVGENFQRQLQANFREDCLPVEDAYIQERLHKAGAYFSQQFDQGLTPWLASLQVSTDNREIRKRLDTAQSWLNEMHAIKRAGIQCCHSGFSPAAYLQALSQAAMDKGKAKATSAPVYGEADIAHPDLFKQLREWRNHKAEVLKVPMFHIMHQKTLVQLAVHLPDTQQALKQIKGIGPKLTERYGEELVALIRAYREDQGIENVSLPQRSLLETAGDKTPTKREDTKKISLELLHSGLTIEEIARKRELQPQTIAGHLAYYIGKGELALAGLITEERRTQLEGNIQDLQHLSLREIKDTLDIEASYGEINLILAHLRHQEKAAQAD